MLPVQLRSDEILVGDHFGVCFQRTLRIPDDDKTYPLPPGLGRFPIYRVSDYESSVPKEWLEHGGFFIPMYQREALWLNFNTPWWRGTAVKVGTGSINAISGSRFDEKLRVRPQDYFVSPDQPWLDGINAGEGFIRQFVATPLGTGTTVESQLSDELEEGGLRLTVIEPKPGRFRDRPLEVVARSAMFDLCDAAPDVSMGLGAGGKMRQVIERDRHGRDTWDPKRSQTVHVHIVNSQSFTTITGAAPPPSPISVEDYNRAGLPWFELYGCGEDVPAPKELVGLRTV